MTAAKKDSSESADGRRKTRSVVSRKPRQPYHHGDLERAAIDAAFAIVSADGPSAVTLRAVAAAVGVNHRALYRYFSSHETLLIQVASRGFAKLADEIGAAKEMSGSPEVCLARAYATFALKEAGLYALMFSLPLRLMFEDFGDMSKSLKRAVHAASLMFTANKSDNPTIIRDKVIRVWGLTHGLVLLYRAGALKARNDVSAIKYISEAAENMHMQ